MLFLDVHVLVGAQRNDGAPLSRPMRSWLESALGGHEAIGVSELALSAMVRIVTHPRVFEQPSAPAHAIAFADALLAAPQTAVVRAGARHWSIFSQLVADHRLRGSDVPDAYYAAIALEHGATLVTADRGFGRFGVRVLDPTAQR
ncbi:toxin-antitoxin system PIN domain toxin [Agrococcus baldri]|uniref:Ribonuclease VapC n=1 Tax=Agrococcus baldri TaxID=153730 RepID=A0AA94HKI6_9MICO|nr:TA system VapC family ribonuclease toxin [Agrococcus baldri]SFS00567.1 toxin-antitoxin system PIN domain toxin [Agrococcus baldri]